MLLTPLATARLSIGRTIRGHMDTAPYRRLLRGTCLVGLVLLLLSTPARAATIELSALASLTQDLQVTATDPITPVTAAIANLSLIHI